MDTDELSRSRELIRLCNVPTGWAHYWRKNPAFSAWYPAGRAARVPQAWLQGDLYFSVNAVTSDNPRGPGHRVQNRHVQQVRVIYADIDPTHNYRYQTQLPPSITVNSGRGTHAYWLLAQPIDAAAAAELQRRWVHFVGGDPAAVDLARVLRVPGSVNTKNGAPVTVETWQPGRRYTADDLAAAIGDDGLCPVRAIPAVTNSLPSQGGDAAGIVSRILASRQGSEFAALMAGQHNYRSASEADAALLRLVAWWVHGDTAQMLSIWQSSGLWRPDRGADYHQRTLQHGLSGMRRGAKI